MMDIGKFYDVVYSLKYDIEYENGVKCIKITPKSYRVERADGTTFLVPQDSILELKKVSPSKKTPNKTLERNMRPRAASHFSSRTLCKRVEMKVEIKSHLIIDDFFISPEVYVPENKNEFHVGFSFDIGPKGTDAAEIFHVNISNKCYKKQVVFIDENIVFRKGCIELEYYDYSKIMKAINKYIQNINCDTWSEVETKLIKVFFGEYENYNR